MGVQQDVAGAGEGGDDGLFADDLDEGLPAASGAGAAQKRKRSASDGGSGGALRDHAASGPRLLPSAVTKPKRAFITSATFTGKRSGYAFKTGASGTGYYADTPPQPASRRAAPAKAAAAAAARVGADREDDDGLADAKRFMKKVRAATPCEHAACRGCGGCTAVGRG